MAKNRGLRRAVGSLVRRRLPLLSINKKPDRPSRKMAKEDAVDTRRLHFHNAQAPIHARSAAVSCPNGPARDNHQLHLICSEIFGATPASLGPSGGLLAGDCGITA